MFRSLVFLCCFAASVHAQDLKMRITVANTTDDIRAFCSRFGQFGDQHEATYTAGESKLFVVWVQPKDRATPAFLFGFVLRSGKWHLLVDYPETAQFARDSVVISVADRTIRLISPDGHVTKTYEIR
jgi:hypothetical protein